MTGGARGAMFTTQRHRNASMQRIQANANHDAAADPAKGAGGVHHRPDTVVTNR